MNQDEEQPMDVNTGLGGVILPTWAGWPLPQLNHSDLEELDEALLALQREAAAEKPLLATIALNMGRNQGKGLGQYWKKMPEPDSSSNELWTPGVGSSLGNLSTLRCHHPLGMLPYPSVTKTSPPMRTGEWSTRRLPLPGRSLPGRS
jgi:hypothetical protein